jgi:hypothetical protein
MDRGDLKKAVYSAYRSGLSFKDVNASGRFCAYVTLVQRGACGYHAFSRHIRAGNTVRLGFFTLFFQFYLLGKLVKNEGLIVGPHFSKKIPSRDFIEYKRRLFPGRVVADGFRYQQYVDVLLGISHVKGRFFVKRLGYRVMACRKSGILDRKLERDIGFYSCFGNLSVRRHSAECHR